MKVYALGSGCIVVLVLLGLLVMGLPGFSQGARTVLDGVYTESQAERGALEYEATCAHCHEGDEPDASPPIGLEFIDRWREAPLNFLFTHIRTNMPGDDPGSLSPAVYLDVLAYLLYENYYPAGNEDLTADQLADILLVGHDGPRPLPADALVRVVGCLVPADADTWRLALASPPVRVLVGGSTTPSELAESTATPVGTAVYTLRNASRHAPQNFDGQRVQVKGVWAPGADGVHTVSVLSFAGAGAGCRD